MKKTWFIYLASLLFIFSCCGQETKKKSRTSLKNSPDQAERIDLINPEGNHIYTRINPPPGYKRTTFNENSFARYLRTLPLKAHDSPVRFYDGTVKSNTSVHVAVVDKKTGDKNLHQCADAVIRLRAEYLWEQKKYDQIHFNFTNGFRVDYIRWMSGNRVKVDGNKTYWIHENEYSDTYEVFWKYLETIFMYAGTLSLSKELVPIKIEDLGIGDVFIQGGSPGHAVIIVDLAENPDTNEKAFLLAQSYMPAQEIHILNNPLNTKISPWFSVNFGEKLVTPEWTFEKNNLKRFTNN